MKALLTAVSVAILLHATSAVAQTAAPAPTMKVLSAQERTELQNRYRNAESDGARNKVRAEIQDRVRSQEMLNRELPLAYRNQLTTQEQRQIRNQMQSANSDYARQGIVNQAQTKAQNRIQKRTQNTQKIQTQQRFKTSVGGHPPNTSRGGNSGTFGSNSSHRSSGSWGGGGSAMPRGSASGGGGGGGGGARR